MIELGANIKLIGFEDLQPAQLIVVKKMVGNYAKKINDTKGAFSELALEKEQENQLKVKCIMNEKTYQASDTNKNLFFALDKALSTLIKQL